MFIYRIFKQEAFMPSLLNQSLVFLVRNEKLLLGAFALIFAVITGEEFPPIN